MESGLDELLLGAFAEAWTQLRFTHDLALRPPAFALHDGRSRLGTWNRGTRTISIARWHALEDPWLEVNETLVHEVAHQVVDELHGGDVTPHGPLFQQVLADLGALPSTVGEPPPVLVRVRKLLALAGSANRHEAELAMAKAQKLMLRHRIDRAKLEGGAGIVRRQLGRPRRRQPRWEGVLVAALATHFGARVVRVPAFLVGEGTWGRVYEIVGRPEDVELVDYAFGFVVGTSERLWKAHRKAHPGAGRSRDRFLYGVVCGFAEKLERTEEEAIQEGLVPVVDGEVDAVWSRRHPRLRTSRGRVRIDRHYHAGREAGSGMVLHRPLRSTGGGGGLLEG